MNTRNKVNKICSILTLALLTQSSAMSTPAPILLDFEQPYFIAPEGLQCKDHYVLKIDDLYHVFYIESFPPEQGEYMRSEKWLGHMTSLDLCHWTALDSILPVSEMPPGNWDDSYIWAPTIIRRPADDMWYLYYTGVNEDVTQQTGLAYSTDLSLWQRWPFNPIYHPGDWSNWVYGGWSNCRDPEIFHEDGAPEYYLLNTASDADGLGAISLATSENLINWDDLPPLFVNDSSNVLESVQLLKRNGLYHLFFTEQGYQGTSHMSSPTLQGAWTKDNRVFIDVSNAPEITFRDGEAALFSRHDAIARPGGGDAIYYYRFDEIDLDTPDDVPSVISLGGLTDTWTIVFGSAFDNQPTWGDNPAYRGDGPSNMEGNSYLATFENFPEPHSGEPGSEQGHRKTGLLRSEPFMLSEDRIDLLVGGSELPDHCFVALVRASDDVLYFLETGEGNFSMNQRIWDTSTLIGESVYVAVADLAFLYDGHISVDSIREYPFDGYDPVTPSEPMVDGPTLEDILAAAGFSSTGAAEPAAPTFARLLAPHPNPFNPQTRLRYELERSGMAELRIHDASGRLVRTLFSGRLESGPGFFTWNGLDDAGRSLASGCYFARLGLDGESCGVQKLVLLR